MDPKEIIAAINDDDQTAITIQVLPNKTRMDFKIAHVVSAQLLAVLAARIVEGSQIVVENLRKEAVGAGVPAEDFDAEVARILKPEDSPHDRYKET